MLKNRCFLAKIGCFLPFFSSIGNFLGTYFPLFLSVFALKLPVFRHFLMFFIFRWETVIDFFYFRKVIFFRICSISSIYTTGFYVAILAAAVAPPATPPTITIFIAQISFIIPFFTTFFNCFCITFKNKNLYFLKADFCQKVKILSVFMG